MSVSARVERLLKDEQARLDEALTRVDATIRSLAPVGSRSATPPAPPSRAGAPGKGAAPQPRPFNPRALQESWRPFADRLRYRLDHDRMVLFPLVIAVERDGQKQRRAELLRLIADVAEDHQTLRRMGGMVRTELMFVDGALRKQGNDVLELFEARARAVDAEIAAGIDGGETPVVPIQRTHTSDNILRQLRQAKPVEEDEEEEEEPQAGFMSRIRGLFARK